MKQIKRLVVDTYDLLERYQRSEAMFDFYPNGLKGIIAERFLSGLNGSLSNPSFDHIDQVIESYHNSPEYHLPEHVDNAPLILIILLEVDRMVHQVVQSHKQDLQRVKVDIETMQWGASYVALEMVK